MLISWWNQRRCIVKEDQTRTKCRRRRQLTGSHGQWTLTAARIQEPWDWNQSFFPPNSAPYHFSWEIEGEKFSAQRNCVWSWEMIIREVTCRSVNWLTLWLCFLLCVRECFGLFQSGPWVCCLKSLSMDLSSKHLFPIKLMWMGRVRMSRSLFMFDLFIQ